MTGQVFLPQLIYKNHLQCINDKNFTLREIDVLACLVSGRNTGTTASFLSISPRTVESHLQNTRARLELSSQQAVIHFLEKSGKLPWFHQYYLSLLAQNTFELGLKKLALQRKNQPLKCQILYWVETGEQKAFLIQIKEHLEKSGIQVVLRDIKVQETHSKYTEGLNPTDSIILIGPASFLNAIKENKPFKSPLMIVLQSSEVHSKEQEAIEEAIPYKGPEAYYDVVLKVLEYCHGGDKVTSQFVDFRKHQENSKGGFSNNLIVEGATSKGFFQTCLQKFNALPKLQKYLAITISCMGLLGAGTFLIIPGPPAASFAQSIRSELKIPAESGFLNRSEIIQKMDEKLKGSKGIERIALVGVVGIGGAGKTTLARQFGRLQDASVVWELNAETKDSLLTSFKDLAYKLAQTEKQKKELDFIQAIQNAEEKEKHLLLFIKDRLREKPNWILICDNVDNLSEIKPYFPEDPKVWGKGKVIITTRDKNIANTMYIKPTDIIDVEELSDGEKLTLFSKIIFGVESDKLEASQKEAAINFLKSIPPFPLDISVAAYYIKNTNINYDQYLERLKTNSEKFDQVQTDLLKEISNYTKTRYGVITLSLKKIIDENPKFKELLFFICLIDSQNIPKELLEVYADKNIVDRFIHSLQKESFIVEKSDFKETLAIPTFSIHRSTQAIGLVFISKFFKEEDKRKWIKSVVVAFTEFYEKHMGNQCEKLTEILSHLESMITALKNINFLKEKVLILEMVGNIHERCTENLILAKKYFSNIVNLNATFVKENVEFFAAILKRLGNVCMLLGEPDAALQWCQKSLTLYETIPNSRIEIFQIFQIFGSIYRKRSEFDKSETYLKNALFELERLEYSSRKGIEVKELKSEIYEQLAILYNMTYLHKKEGYKAEEYALKSLELFEAEKPMNNSTLIKNKAVCYVGKHKLKLGEIYMRLGKYQEALNTLKDVQHMLDLNLDPCFQLTRRYQLFIDFTEIKMRQNDLRGSEEQLTEFIDKMDQYIGKSQTFTRRVLRAEVRIRKSKFEEAYKDCQVVFHVERKENNNYLDLMYLTAHYHAAFIKYKQHDFKKSAEHFADFFKQMDEFSQRFLEPKEYEELKAQNVFASIDLNKIPTEEDMTYYLHRSTQIFSSIYGPEHPFVKDYVVQNEKNNFLDDILLFIRNIPFFS